jgi:predicted ATPase
MRTIESLDLEGFKSIEALHGLELRDLNVLIGANGAGKSNLIDFFRLLRWMVSSPGGLQRAVVQFGGANAVLHDGAKQTRSVKAHLRMSTRAGQRFYSFQLSYAPGDDLVISEEEFGTKPKFFKVQQILSRQAAIALAATSDDGIAEPIVHVLKRIGVYHFGDTSETARIKQLWSPVDSDSLKEDGGNLGPVLLRLQRSHPRHYRRLVEVLRQVVPQFGDFALAPNDSGKVLLRWTEEGSDLVFGPEQASDGTLRCMALLTLLLQPREMLPSLMIIDEPELGLHPRALDVLAGVIRDVARDTQVIVATQSETLLDHFSPDDVIVVDREGRNSRFDRLDAARLESWLAEYSMAELWEKNVLGGRPA